MGHKAVVSKDGFLFVVSAAGKGGLGDEGYKHQVKQQRSEDSVHFVLDKTFLSGGKWDAMVKAKALRWRIPFQFMAVSAKPGAVRSSDVMYQVNRKQEISRNVIRSRAPKVLHTLNISP